MRTFRHETALYLLALFLALAVRLVGLDGPPLNDLEAKWALQALGLAQGSHPALGSQAAYVALTSILFFVYGGATNFLARLIPALAGSALALLPRLFRERLKPRPALVLGFFLALEPGLVALSRQAGSSILAITFLVSAWGMWNRRRSSWAGVFGGLALLSGASLWLGLLTFGVAWAISQAWRQGARTPSPGWPAVGGRHEGLTALGFCLATIVFGGSLFLLSPSGLSAWLSGVPEFLAGWVHVSGPPTGLMLFSLVAYQPLGLILALVASARGWLQRSWRVRQLSLWMLIGLLLALFYPSRQIGDLAWMLIPLWALAALELARSLNLRPDERREVLGVVALSFLLLVFIWLDFLGLIRATLPSDQATLRLWLIYGSFFLLVMSLLLVAVGWSQRVARYGAIWGLFAALAIYGLGALMGAAGLRDLPDGVELWRPGSSLPESGLLLSTVNDMSAWSQKDAHAQSITIVAIDSPALAWLFRERAVSIQSTLDPSAEPPMVVAVDEENPRLAAAYRGQSFVWRRTPSWGESSLTDWLRWLPFHQIPQESDRLILWVRSDLFLDSTAPRP